MSNVEDLRRVPGRTKQSAYSPSNSLRTTTMRTHGCSCKKGQKSTGDNEESEFEEARMVRVAINQKPDLGFFCIRGPRSRSDQVTFFQRTDTFPLPSSFFLIRLFLFLDLRGPGAYARFHLFLLLPRSRPPTLGCKMAVDALDHSAHFLYHPACHRDLSLPS
jgi:hypothetical protein